MRRNADTEEMWRATITHEIKDPAGNILAGPFTQVCGPYRSRGTAKGVATQETNYFDRNNERAYGPKARLYEYTVKIERARTVWEEA